MLNLTAYKYLTCIAFSEVMTGSTKEVVIDLEQGQMAYSLEGNEDDAHNTLVDLQGAACAVGDTFAVKYLSLSWCQLSQVMAGLVQFNVFLNKL